MKTSYNFLLSVVGLLTYSVVAHSEVCDWAKKTPEDDSRYKYFVAREFSTKSRKDAKVSAENNITQQVCNILGNYLSSASDSYEDENIDNATSSTAQRSRCLGIYKQNFERLNADDGKIDGEYIACVKYRYLKSSLEAEQKRITKEGTSSASMLLNEHIGDTDCEGHPLEIKTNPAGANIFIDDSPKYIANTPVRFGNVCNSAKILKLTLPNYDTITVNLSPKDKTIFKELKRSTKRINIITNLGNSTIKILDADGFQKKEKKGIKELEYEFLLGANYQIVVENDISKGRVENLKVDEDTKTSIRITLDKLPGKMDFTAFNKNNPDVDIYVDGRHINSKNGKYETEPLDVDIEHKIKLKKEGYETISEYKSVKPKETFNYPSDKLKFKKDLSPAMRMQNALENSWFWVGIKENIGNFKNEDFNTPIKSFGIESHIFLGKRFSFDFEITTGSSEITSQFGDISDRSKNSTASYLFSRNSPYVNFKISQKFLQLYSGMSLYLSKNPYVTPFISVGYNKISNLSYELEDYDSNFLTKENIEKMTKIETSGPMVSVGAKIFSIFNITGKYSPNYYGISCGITIPTKF